MPIAYGQVFEDTFLQRIFADRIDGVYVDIGAWHPVKYNISFPFYLQGWRGVCIDPLDHYVSLARRLRPEDINVQCLVGSAPGEAILHFAHGLDGLSTTVDRYGEMIAIEDVELAKRTYPVRTLADILGSSGVAEIDFLKIDVEGAERDVLVSNDWSVWRPKVLVIEGTVPGTDIPAWDEWEPLLIELGYLFAGFDTLNRYYVRADMAQLVDGLDIDRKPWSEATYLYDLGSALDNPEHVDSPIASALGKLLCGGIAARPDLAARLIRAALDDGGGERMNDGLLRRLNLLDTARAMDWPALIDGETVVDYLTRALQSPHLRAAVGRFSAFMAR